MKVKKKGLATIAALLSIIFVLSSVIATGPPRYWQGDIPLLQNISVQEAYAYLKYGLNTTTMIVLDVRTWTEYNASHIKGGAYPALEAINIPYDQLATNLTAYGTASCPLTGHKDDLVIVYCGIGKRSTNASETLENNPSGVVFTNVYNVIGGFTQYYLNTIGNSLQANPTLYWNFSDTVVVNATAPPPTYTVIQVSDAYLMITSGSPSYGSSQLVLDARTPGEYNTQHIVNSTTPPILNAINIDYESDSAFATLLASSPVAGHYSDPITLYCQNEACGKSAGACQYLVTHGYSKVYRMYGGLDAWIAAGYPTAVSSAPNTFGYTTVGGQSGWWGGSALCACKFTSPSDCGTITQITVYMYGHVGSVNAKACIYADSNGVPGSLLATTSEVTNIGTSASWVNFSINYAASPNAVYWLGVEASGDYCINWNTGSTNQETYQYSMSYPAFPSPWTSYNGQTNYGQSIYATYTNP